MKERKRLGINWGLMCGLLASGLYVIVPYGLFFDRYALVDSMLAMFGIWTMVFTLFNLRNPRLDLTMLVGVSLGLAWMTKSPGVFFLGLLPVTSLLTWPEIKEKPWLGVRQAISYGISGVIAVVMYNLLRLGPEFHQIGLRNKDYIYPWNEVMDHWWGIFSGNFHSVSGFYWILMTPGVVILALLGIWFTFRSAKLVTLWLLVWWWLPVLAQSLVARAVTARYFLYTTPAILLFAAIGLGYIISTLVVKRTWLYGALLAIFIPTLWLDWAILTNPLSARLPRIERSGYLEEWTAGFGLREIATYLEKESEQSSVVVGTEGFFGTTPDGLQIYFDKHPNVRVVGNSYSLDHVPDGLYEAAAEHKTFLVVNNDRLHIDNPESVGLTLIKAFPKAIRPDGSQQQLLFFEVSRPTKTS